MLNFGDCTFFFHITVTEYNNEVIVEDIFIGAFFKIHFENDRGYRDVLLALIS